MEYLIRVLHGLGAIAAGFYLLLPFLTGKLASLSGESLIGYSRVLFSFNRIGQYLLIAQFITGGYLISKAEYSWTWIILVLVLFLIVGALPGIMSKSLKHILNNADDTTVQKSISKVGTFSIVIAIVLLVLIYLMYYPMYR
jgi:hypothetical protein